MPEQAGLFYVESIAAFGAPEVNDPKGVEVAEENLRRLISKVDYDLKQRILEMVSQS